MEVDFRAKQLKKKIDSRKADVVVIGMGYVGLPLAIQFAQVGFSVTGLDVDAKKVKAIQKGTSYIGDVPSRDLKQLLSAKRLKASTQFERIRKADVVIVCVPTPLNRSREPDLSYVIEVTDKLRTYLHSGLLVVLESTTYPGTTDELIRPQLENSRRKVGKDFYLCYSPERIDPANPCFKVQEIPKVVGGTTRVCQEMGRRLYETIIPQVHTVSSTQVAEMTKIIENTFRIVNIGLVNELATISHRLGLDIWEAIEAASTKPFGYMPFYPGPGIGGHCIGIDPIYLSWKAGLHGKETRFIDLASRTNAAMPAYVVERSHQALNERGKSLRDSLVLVIGAAYKKDVDDIRESPALDIIDELVKKGARVSYHDPYVPKLEFHGRKLLSKPLSDQVISQADIVILVTNHSRLNYEKVIRRAKLIFDARNALKGFKTKRGQVVKL